MVLPTDQLKEEHVAIKDMLKVINKVSQKLENREAVDASHLEMVVEFIRFFADKYHHGKEEALLFPAMEEAGMPKEGGPIGAMLTEHDFGREFVREMANAIAGYKRAEPLASVEFVRNARGYADLLSQHIDKEDDILYEMANRHLSESKQRELLKKFDNVEESTVGSGRHQELLTLLDYLKSTYLK